MTRLLRILRILAFVALATLLLWLEAPGYAWGEQPRRHQQAYSITYYGPCCEGNTTAGGLVNYSRWMQIAASPLAPNADGDWVVDTIPLGSWVRLSVGTVPTPWYGPIRSITVRVMDTCLGCQAARSALDLSEGAFRRLSGAGGRLFHVFIEELP